MKKLVKLRSLLLSLVIILFLSNQANVVAFNSNKEACQETKRNTVVSYMNKMATIEWIPRSDITFYMPEFGSVFKAGVTYKGIPYSQQKRNTNYEIFLNSIQNIDGRPIYAGPTESDKYLGS